jgi:hypothetical protein
MRFNDRAMALAGIPDLPVDAFKKEGGKIKLHGGGGGPTTTKSETSNIPEYARPYVERMMGATEKQVYTYGPSGNITGFQPYKPFEGETVAGFTPMQSQAMKGIQNYQLPGQTAAATGLTGMGTLASMGAGQQYAQQATNPYATQAYMSPYMEGALQPQMREAARQSAMLGQQNQAQAVQQGAFGGSRSAIVEAERQRNLAQQQEDIYGKGLQSAFEDARRAQQFGAELGLKGYGQGMQGAEQLAKIGQQQYGQEMGLLGQQMEIGGKQQAYEQARLNQIIQDYATQQQYPFIQLGTLSNMLRGLPMQASTTQMYQAQPSVLQQGIGLAGAAANLKQAGMFAEGGDVKEMASGGIASGVDPNKLPGMMKKLSDDQLEGKLGGDTDPETMGIAQAEKQRRDQVRAGAPKMAGGGAVAFKNGGTDEIGNPFIKNEVKPREEKKPEIKTVKKEAPAKAPVLEPVSATPYKDRFEAELAASKVERPEFKPVREYIASEQERVKEGVEGEMDRMEKLRQKFGIDPTKILEQERARYREELKLNDEDYRKAQHLRYAQMFARFGSTPGPVLKAALVSINEVVPDLLDDKTKANAVRREIKKAMFELDKSEYQEKKGNLDAAYKNHQDAAGRFATLSMDLGNKMLDADMKRVEQLGGAARTETTTQSAERVSKEENRTRREIAATQERSAERRHQATEARIAQQDKRREDSNTRDYQAALSKGDKDSGYYEKRDQLDSRLQHGTPEAKESARQELIKLEREREERKAELRRMYPDARTGADTSAKPTAGEIKYSSSDIEDRVNKYK